MVVFAFFVAITACDKEDEAPLASATLTSEVTNILQGDTAELVVDITGGVPPYGFRYSDGVESYYELGIEQTPHIIKVTPDSTRTYTAEAVGTYYRNVGTASGSATIEVTPVQYVLDQTFTGVNSGFLHGTNGWQAKSDEIQIKTDDGSWDRRGFYEFDASQITTVEQYNKYTFSFWLVKSHGQGVNAGLGAMEVKGYVGEIDNSWTWNTQPGLDVLIDGYTQQFTAVSQDMQIEFKGDITSIVHAALASPSKKFTLRVIENVNGEGNGGFYYIGGTSWWKAEQRPAVGVLLRRPID